jgi:putative salt-induced outer membrane protein YdiY
MILLALLLAQTVATTPAATADSRAAIAAEQAAMAAQKAAEAALRAVEAIERSQRASGGDKSPEASKAETTAAAKTAQASAAKAADAAEKAVAAAPPNPVIWSGTVALGLIALTGNSQTITFSTNGAFERKSTDWIVGIKTYAAYGNTTAAGAGASTVTALAAGLQARGDRRFSDVLSIYLLGGIDTDHLKSIESRPFGEGGVSIIWFDDKVGDLQKSTFKTDLGFRYGHEYRFLYYGVGAPARQDGVDIVAPRVGAFYRYAISKDVIFTEDASALENLVGTSRALVTSTTKLSSRLTEKVALGVGFAVNYDSAPPPMKVNTDTALTVGLEIGL